MVDVFFKLRVDLPSEAVEAVLERIEALPGVERAGPIKKDASRPALRALCFARIAQDTDVEALVSAIRAMPEVQSAELPARRGLA